MSNADGDGQRSKRSPPQILRAKPRANPAPADPGLVTDNMAPTSRAANRARGRRLHLTVLADRDFAPSLDDPPPRDVCRQRPSSEPCAFVLCRHHLFTGEPHGRPRSASSAPRSDWTDAPLEVRVTAGPSCMLELPPRARPTREVAELLGVTPRQVQQDLRRALGKLAIAGVDFDTIASMVNI